MRNIIKASFALLSLAAVSCGQNPSSEGGASTQALSIQPTYKTYLEYCNAARARKLSDEESHTVGVLNRVAQGQGGAANSSCAATSVALEALTELDVSRARIRDVRAIATLKNVEFLSVAENRMLDISPLGLMPKVTFLVASENYNTLRCPAPVLARGGECQLIDMDADIPAKEYDGRNPVFGSRK